MSGQSHQKEVATMAMRQAKSDDTQNDLATQRTRARDDDQKALDGEVGTLVKEWESAGSPLNGVPNRRYEVDDVAEAKRRVNRAFTLISKDRTPKLSPMWYKDGTKDSDGYTAIKFAVRVSTVADKAEADKAETPPNAPAVAPEVTDPPPFDQGTSDQEGEAAAQADQADQSRKGGRFARR